jgi:hypothetical protein
VVDKLKHEVQPLLPSEHFKEVDEVVVPQHLSRDEEKKDSITREASSCCGIVSIWAERKEDTGTRGASGLSKIVVMIKMLLGGAANQCETWIQHHRSGIWTVSNLDGTHETV